MFGLIYPHKEGVPVQGCKKQVSKLSHLLIVTLTVKELPAFTEPLGSLPCFRDYYGYLMLSMLPLTHGLDGYANMVEEF
jgi:hypothetical protein